MLPKVQVRNSLVLILFFIFTCVVPCFGENTIMPEAGSDCITQIDQGIINWSTGKIIAIGKADPGDEKEIRPETILGSARADANRQIIEVLQQIKIHPRLSVGQYAAQNDVILAGMEKTAWDAVVVKQFYTSAFAVEVRIETSMYGGFMQLVLPEEIRQIPKINPQIPKTEKTTEVDPPYTGLIIDAKGLKLSPILNPIIRSEQGHDAYSSVFISREFAVQNGVCKYVCQMKAAKNQSRIGNRPLIFKGLRKTKDNHTIVISTADYQFLERLTERHTFLAECRVVIVID